jgi:hypothetical protein
MAEREMSISDQLLKARLAFARHGIPTIPLRHGAKEPLSSLAPRGAHDATADPDVIRQQCIAAPTANTGATLGGFGVIDRDDRNGGQASLIDLERRYGPLPRTWGVLTAGGEHAWYRLPAGVTIRGGNNRLGPGLDVKTGAGSYVVVPPSLHPSGVRYEWRCDAHPRDTPLARAPAWLIRLLTPAPAPAPKPFRPRTDDDRRITEALSHIPSDDRETWVRIGMALRGHFGDAGRAIWDSWSATSQKYDPKVQERVWKSFRRGGVGIGTIFHFARENARVA